MIEDFEFKKNLESVQPIQILLAESDPTEISRFRARINQEFQEGVQFAKNYDELLERITEQQPQLVFLGRIDKTNYRDLSKGCRTIQPDLSIVLLSEQKTISESFRELLKTCGLTDVVSQDPETLNQLLQTFSDREQHLIEPI